MNEQSRPSDREAEQREALEARGFDEETQTEEWGEAWEEAQGGLKK